MANLAEQLLSAGLPVGRSRADVIAAALRDICINDVKVSLL